MNKTCCKCGLEKPIEEFGKSTESKDGLKYSCKSCRNQENIDYRKTHRIRCYTPAIGTVKTCDICKKEKAIEEFGKDCCQKDGRTRRCKLCFRQFQKDRYVVLSKENRPITKEHKVCSRCRKDKSIRDFYKTRAIRNGSPHCKACWSEIRKSSEYKQKHSERDKKNAHKYNVDHREDKSKYNFKYGQDPINKKSRTLRVTNRRKTDINFKIRCSLGSSLRSQIVRQGTIKSDHTMALVGCSIEFLKKYIEDQFTEGMTWNNYGRKGWSIDHIRPCASFDLTKPEEQQICFHYTNLRPLWESDNVKKSSWYNGKLYRIKSLTSSANNV